MKKPYIFLDGGGTIIFPNAELLCEIALNFGYSLSPEDFIKAFLETTFYFDNLLRREGLKDNKVFYNLIPFSLEKIGISLEEGIRIREIARKKANGLLWTYTLLSIREGLRILNSEGYSLSVISNSDGTVEEQIRKARLGKYFEKIYDSRIRGIVLKFVQNFGHKIFCFLFLPAILRIQHKFLKK